MSSIITLKQIEKDNYNYDFNSINFLYSKPSSDRRKMIFLERAPPDDASIDYGAAIFVD